MEEKIKELLESALEVKVQIVDEEFKFVTIEFYKHLPVPGDIINHDFKKYEVIRREFEETGSYSYGRDYYCTIVVKCLTSKEED